MSGRFDTLLRDEFLQRCLGLRAAQPQRIAELFTCAGVRADKRMNAGAGVLANRRTDCFRG